MTILFQALTDDTRRAILELLRQRNLAAGEIADHFHLGKPTVSHHLDLLKRAGLVTSEKKGQFIIYSLSTSVLEDAIRWLLSLTRMPSKTKCHDKHPQEKLAPPARDRNTVRLSRPRLATDS